MKPCYRFMFRRKLPPVLRAVAAIMIPVQIAAAVPGPVLAAALSNFSQSGAGNTAPSFIQPPAVVFENQPKQIAPIPVKVPTFDRPSTVLHFSSTPSDREIIQARGFQEPLCPSGAEGAASENADLARALTSYIENPRDLSPLLDFTTKYESGRWNASILANLGVLYRSRGQWSKALSAWEKSWALTKDDADVAMKNIADRALGDLAQMHARLGHFERLEELFKETNARDVRGAGTDKVDGARAGLWLMKNVPSEAFRCGPLAVGSVFEVLFPGKTTPESIRAMPSTQAGTCLSDLAELAVKSGIDFQMAFRESNAAVLIPAVVNWKVGHFAALVQDTGAGYVSKDGTFGTDVTVSKEVLDEEASGYFLVPAGPLPAGWRSVTKDEGKKVWGKGNAGPGGPLPPPCFAVTAGCESCSSPGMAKYRLELSGIGLLIVDTPVGYSPPYGPSVAFTANYNHREGAAMSNVSNLGPKWSFDWLNYIVAPSDANTNSYGPGGGQLDYTGFDASTGKFLPQLLSQDRLVKLSASSYEKYRSDGSKDIFDLAESGANPRIFRTKSIDAIGRVVTYAFDSNYRLRTVTDATGKVTVVDYALTADPLSPDFFKITKVTDPFGRFASFEYNALGQLFRITDVIGIVSEFSYSTGDFIDALTTPYGTTQFALGDVDQYHRWLEVTDPMGAKERIEFNGLGDGPMPGSEFPIPPEFVNGNISARNTFYWDKKAMAEAPGDYTKAQITHWLHADGGARVISVPESTKQPLENRVWFAYPNQSDSRFLGSLAKPSKEIRYLDDGSAQIFQREYNLIGKLTKLIDPVGRETEFEYDSNLVDLLKVKQKNGLVFELLEEYTYDARHLCLTKVDASGQVTTFTYNSQGQISTVTNAKNEITTFYYDPAASLNTTDVTKAGYLVAIDGPLPGVTDSVLIAYDAYGRQRTVTETDGYIITSDYDAFDRVTTRTFPDSTFEQFLYNRLDLEWMRDRLGRWTHQAHDSLRRVSFVVDPLNRVTQYDWCTCGSLNAIVDANGNRTSWKRDIQRRITEKSYADGHADTFVFESTTSRLRTSSDGKNLVTYAYNADNSVAGITYTDTTGAPSTPPTPAVIYFYDPIYSRIASMTDGVGTTTYTYNPIVGTPILGAGRLASVTGPIAGAVVSYQYDELGRVVSRAIDGAANTSTVHYDTLGRTDQESNLLGVFNYGYVGATRRLHHVNYPNGQLTNYSYFPSSSVPPGNDDLRLQQIENLRPGGANLSTFGYSYDSGGQIRTWSQKLDVGSVLTSSFEYDAAGQLTEARIPNSASIIKTYVYRYDKAGNRSSEQIDSGVTAATVNNINQITALAPTGLIRFEGTLDESGTVTVNGIAARVDASHAFSAEIALGSGTQNVTVVAKDSSNNTTTQNYQLVVANGTSRSIEYDDAGNETDSGAGQTFTWDALNRLIKITQASGVTEFVYDGSGRRVQEKLNGSLIKQWVWCDGPQPAEERDAAGAVTKRFFSQGEQIDGSDYYFCTDHLGSVREMTDATGAVRARFDYDPYGRTTKVSGDLEADFGFTGFYRHPASGLNLTLFRAYDADLGRWLSRDPIAERGGLNLYAYVKNNPANFVDPWGLNPIVVEWSAAEVVAAGAAAILMYDAMRQESLTRTALQQTLDSIAQRRVDMTRTFGDEDWKPRTRERQADRMGGEDTDVTKGRRMTPEERRKLKKEIEDFKKGTGRGGADNIDPDEIDEIGEIGDDSGCGGKK